MAFDLSEALERIEERIEEEVQAGFDPPDRILEGVREWLSDEYVQAGDLAGPAEKILDRVLAKHRAAQSGWPETTDCDRLDRAFAALEEGGVVARQHFTCCQTCGHAEIWDEIHEVVESGKAVHGYTFFHWQDTESAQAGHGLYLAYGAVLSEEGSEEDLQDRACGVAREVVAALQGSGLRVDWDGSTSTRILVPMDWKRRTPA